MSNQGIRVLIADDHPVFRFGLRALIQAEPGLSVAGEAHNGSQAVAQAASLEPDVILMDINMPDLNGIEATRAIVASQPAVAILIITMFDDDTVFAAMKAGAKGYLLKGAEGEETLRAIRAVAAGQIIFSPGIAGRIMAYMSQPMPPVEEEPLPELSEREREILTLMAQGLTNTAIAGKLYLSPKTVRNHVSNIYSKLQVADRVEAVLRARDAGLS